MADVSVTEKEERKPHHDPMVQLEDMLHTCKFGKFGVRLMVTCFAASLANNFVVTSTSFVVPNAECDLKMTIIQKGILTSTPFIGQIATAFFTGFITDAFGRKPFLVIGHIALFFCCLAEGSSQNYWMMFVVKLIEGIMVCFSFNTTPALLSEMVHGGVRDRVMIVFASSMALSSVLSALMAWAVLPAKLDFVLVEGYFELHSWNIFLYVCSIWSGLAGIMFYFLPESPKFLLSSGQADKAYEVVKLIYEENHGVTDAIPLKPFTNISDDANNGMKKSLKSLIVESLINSKDLFRSPILYSMTLVSGMVFSSLLSVSALRLWFPQISTIVENYKNNNGASARFCVMINDYTQKNAAARLAAINVTEPVDCVAITSGSETYTNSMLMGVVSLTCMIFNVFLIKYIPQKPIMITLLLLCVAFSTSLYWTKSSFAIALMISGSIGFTQATYSLLNTIFVRIFPTRVRTRALSLVLSIGRLGSLCGSILFPVLLEAGCMIPFGLLAACATISMIIVILLPIPDATEKSQP